MNFIKKIDKVMKDKNISAYQLEEEVQLAHSTISSWKRGTTPTIDKAIKVIRYLGLSADEIFEIYTKDSLYSEEVLSTEELCSLALLLGNIDSFLIGHIVGSELAENVSCDMQRIFNKCIRNLVRKNIVSDKYNNEDVEKMKRIANRIDI